MKQLGNCFVKTVQKYNVKIGHSNLSRWDEELH
jgi:hypothetical protein